MQLLKWFSLMKEIVMCNNNLRLRSPLTKVGGGGGGDSYLKSDF